MFRKNYEKYEQRERDRYRCLCDCKQLKRIRQQLQMDKWPTVVRKEKMGIESCITSRLLGFFDSDQIEELLTLNSKKRFEFIKSHIDFNNGG